MEASKSKGRRSPIWFTLRVAVLAYAGLALVLAGCQRHLIYHPARAGETELVAQAPGAGLEEWRDRDGQLVGWKSAGDSGADARKRVVVFHGNAGMALYRTYYATGLHGTGEGESWDVFLFEYPGFGAREGRPSEGTFYEAAREALEEIFAEGDEPVYLIGESLGSGVATRMAADYSDRIEGLFLVTPFPKLADVGARVFPWLPVRLLLREEFDNSTALAQYGGPVAVLLAEHDEVVPADLGQRLYDEYEGPKTIWIQEGKNHNTLNLTSRHHVWEDLIDFWSENRGS